MNSDSVTQEVPRATPEIAEHEPALKSGKARRLYLILGSAVALLLVGYVIYYFMTAGKESTDDAQITADVVPVAARVAGQITEVDVVENAPVRKGQLLALIDPSDAEVKFQQMTADLETARAQATAALARASISGAMARGSLGVAEAGLSSSKESVNASTDAIAQAEASLRKTEANAQKAHLDYGRAVELGGKGDIPRAQVDAAKAADESAAADVAQARAAVHSANDARSRSVASVQEAEGKLTQRSVVAPQIAAAQADAALAQAKVKSAEAALAAAQLTLSYTRIVAPADGIASKLAVHPGQQVMPGQPIVELVPPKSYIVANFKETQVKSMKPGQKAKIDVDVIPGKEFEGRVESISGGTGSTFSLLPPDNASGNFVKVVQRVPVRISWNGPDPSHAAVGSSAAVTVYTK
jgi:membrane fusion protein (multidrug efflux system)